LAEFKDWWKDLALEVYKKRYGSEVPDDYQEKTKRMAFLRGRGFTAEQINYALSHVES
jgi:SOS response regulatory protein OraA/RecX